MNLVDQYLETIEEEKRIEQKQLRESRQIIRIGLISLAFVGICFDIFVWIFT